ncbi:MAG: TonB-dependent receptor [Bacteroidales bacterium]|nr:TonB-dependent receptor [Bacteroidales bacterium]
MKKKSNLYYTLIIACLCINGSQQVYSLDKPSNNSIPANNGEDYNADNNSDYYSIEQNQLVIKGKVLDDKSQSLPGATVMVKNSTRGVTTDIDGSFNINVSKDDILIISYLGMVTQEIKIGNDNSIVVKMKEKTDELDEVTIVAYGKQKKASVIGAITTISSENLKVPVARLSTSLAGQLAGIVAIQRSGEPGAGSDFWIRGISSFGANNRPLILVDGVERALDLVDPEDIASFSILKDATATALYGVRGANGIVLITTKRGKESKPSVNVRVEYGVAQPTKIPKMANAEDWIDYYNEINLEGNGNIVYQPSTMQKYFNYSDPDLYPNVDWWDQTFKNNSNNMRANINVSGGNKNIRYYVAGSYYSENGIFKPVDNKMYDPQVGYKKFNFRANIDVDITEYTQLALSLSNQYETKNRLGVAMEDVFSNTLVVPPVAVTPIFSDGSLSRPTVGINPYLQLNYTGYSWDFWNNSQSLISLTQDFKFLLDGLKGNAKFSWDARSESTLDRRKTPATYEALGRDKDGNLILHQNRDGNDFLSLARSNRGSRVWNFETSLTYEKIFSEQHRVNALALFNMREYTDNFPSNFIAAFPNRNIGFAGRVAYSFKDTYFTELNFGYNGSENFAPGKRFGFFPSVAVGYIISNEEFWQPFVETINLLKIKGSYGEIGNDQIGGNRRFAYNSEMTYTGSYTYGKDNANTITGIATGNPGNPDVSWETAKKSDIGFELGLLNHFKISADYFSEKRDGIYILQQSVPSVVGINVAQYVNLGKMNNKGVDMSAEYENQINKDIYLSLRGNLTYNRNRVEYDDKPSQMYKYLNDVGFPYGQHRGLVSEGLFASWDDIENSPKQTFGSVRPGDIKYRDIDGNGIIDSNDRIPMGCTTTPEINYGFGASSRWKDFDISIFFQGAGRVGRMISGSQLMGSSSNIQMYGNLYKEAINNRWSLNNPDVDAEFPRFSLSDANNNTVQSSYWWRNMDYIRLKNAEIGYSIPKRLLSDIGLARVRIYIQGVNLLTFSKFKMWDPELSTGSGSAYPQMRTVSAGVNVNF